MRGHVDVWRQGAQCTAERAARSAGTLQVALDAASAGDELMLAVTREVSCATNYASHEPHTATRALDPSPDP